MKTALVIPTYNPKFHAQAFLKSLHGQSLQPNVLLLVDSGSDDDALTEYATAGFVIHKIDTIDFNHGGTRQLVVNMLFDVDVIILMTQDAHLINNISLERLVCAFEDDAVGAAYGRQLPHKDANPIESHARIFNYLSESQTKSLEDCKQLGIKTCFMSNSFAAYRCSALQQVGGFPEHNIVSEDTYVAAKMLETGWKIKYCADATVYHSHSYTMMQEFQRYFDLGVFHSREPWIRSLFGQAEGEGKRFVLSQLAFLLKENVFLVPSALLRTVFKYFGFRLGLCEAYLPNRLKMWLSMQKNFWMKG